MLNIIFDILIYSQDPIEFIVSENESNKDSGLISGKFSGAKKSKTKQMNRLLSIIQNILK